MGKCFSKARLIALCLVLLFLCLSGNSIADTVPAGVEPGQIEKRFEKPVLPKSTLEPFIPKMEKPMPPDKSDKIKVVLSGVIIESSTIYSDADFLPLYEEHLGKEVTLTTIYKIAEAITAKYGNDGYPLSRAALPAQKVKNGIVRITIIEGFIDKIIFEGELPDKRGFLDYYEKKILASKPLNSKILERYLLLANDLAGVTAKSIFEPSEEKHGASTLTITTEQKKFDGSISLDNRGSESIGPVQAILSGGMNSVLRQFNRTSLSAITTTPWEKSENEELNYASLQYEDWLTPEGLKLGAFVTVSKSKPGTEILRILEFESESLSFGFHVSYPCIRTRKQNLTFKGNFDHKYLVSYQLDQKASEDNLRIARLGVDYDYADQHQGINQFNIQLSQGLDVLGATDNDDPLRTRVDGKNDFTKLTVKIARTQQLPGRWSAYAAVMGQKAFSGLPSSEESGFGGEAFGRAYDSSEITGDSSIFGSFEIRYLAPANPFKYLQFYGFYDIGEVYHWSTLNNDPDHENASSAGIGLRCGLGERFIGSLEAAKPLTRDVSVEGDKNIRFFVKIAASF